MSVLMQSEADYVDDMIAYIPVDIANVKDLTIGDVCPAGGGWRIASNKFYRNTGLAKIGAHSKICDGCNHGDGGGNVVKNPARTRFGKRKSDEGKGRNGHDRRDGLLLSAFSEDFSRAMGGNTQYQFEPSVLMPMAEVTPLTPWGAGWLLVSIALLLMVVYYTGTA